MSYQMFVQNLSTGEEFYVGKVESLPEVQYQKDFVDQLTEHGDAFARVSLTARSGQNFANDIELAVKIIKDMTADMFPDLVLCPAGLLKITRTKVHEIKAPSTLPTQAQVWANDWRKNRRKR